MAILPRKRLFLWDTPKYVFLFLSSCLIPVPWRLCSSTFWVSESHLSGDASGCGKVFPPAPSCTGFMFVNSQAWFYEGSFPLPFVDVMPSPRLELMPSPSLRQGWVPSGESYYPHFPLLSHLFSSVMFPSSWLFIWNSDKALPLLKCSLPPRAILSPLLLWLILFFTLCHCLHFPLFFRHNQNSIFFIPIHPQHFKTVPSSCILFLPSMPQGFPALTRKRW